MITLAKLTEVCRLLNKEGVKYIIIGGCAIFIHGYERTTQDIDLLIDPSDENIEGLKKALNQILPEACLELKGDDVRENLVVRMAGEGLTIDLIQRVFDIDYEKIKGDVIIEEIYGIKIPYASLESMLKLKEGLRDVDKKDYLFLLGKKQYLEQIAKAKK